MFGLGCTQKQTLLKVTKRGVFVFEYGQFTYNAYNPTCHYRTF